MTIEELQAEVEKKNGELAEANKTLTAYKEKLGDPANLESFTDLKGQRDNQKAEIANLKTEILDLKKNGSTDEATKKLLDEKLKELETITDELNKIKPQAEKAATLEADIIKELMEQLPAEHKEIAEGMEIPKLRAYVKLHGIKKPHGTDNGNGNGGQKIELTDTQKKEAKEMFPYVSDEVKRNQYYIEAKGLNKKKE